MKREPLSLKAYALSLLARREYSRHELRPRLLSQARKLAERGAPHPPGGATASADLDPMLAFMQGNVAPDGDTEPPPPPDDSALATQVDEVLDWLAQRRHQSDERFVESRVHTRSARFGQARIRQELARHGLALAPEAARELRDSELDRAREVWLRKFGAPATDPNGRAKQARFLAARGFSSDVVWRLVGGRDED